MIVTIELHHHSTIERNEIGLIVTIGPHHHTERNTIGLYIKLNSEINDNQNIDLHDEIIHRPENCRGVSQKLLIYIHLLVHYEWQNIHHEVPQCHHIKIQGKPGTGKSFVINTMRNITKSLFKSNKCDEATAPTGCAASLINGKTHFRSLRIPVASKKFHDVTTNVVISNAVTSKGWHDRWRQIFLFIMDEDSMAGRPFWAWFKHRLEQARGPTLIENDGNGESMSQVAVMYPIPDDLYNRAWGGVPIVCSFGDCHQLPPVGMKASSNLKTPPKLHTSDMQVYSL